MKDLECLLLSQVCAVCTVFVGWLHLNCLAKSTWCRAQELCTSTNQCSTETPGTKQVSPSQLSIPGLDKVRKRVVFQVTVGQAAGCQTPLNRNMFTMLLYKRKERKARQETKGKVFWRTASPLHLFHSRHCQLQGYHICPCLWKCIALWQSHLFESRAITRHRKLQLHKY